MQDKPEQYPFDIVWQLSIIDQYSECPHKAA